MKAFRVIISCLVLGLVLGACQSRQKSQEGGSWPDKMQKMSSAVSDLIPYIYSRKEFADPKNEKKVKRAVKTFSSAVHNVPPSLGEKILGADPLIKYSIRNLNDDVERAIKGYDLGHKEYARSLLRGSVGYCFNCHSSTGFGPEFTLSANSFSDLRLEPTEKAELLVATRQYDKAMDILSAKLNDPINFYEDPYELERALKKYLAVVVRVKQDPAKAIDTIDKFLQRKNVPYYLAEDSRRWEKSLRRWMGEKNRTVTLKSARGLVKRGKDLQSNYTYQAGHIEYLRATSSLHTLLRAAKTKNERGMMYSLLGDSYEVISDLGFWNLPELYFEACVREMPNTKMAQSCYKRFEKNVVFGFSGSAGIFIPAEERARLRELRKISGL